MQPEPQVRLPRTDAAATQAAAGPDLPCFAIRNVVLDGDADGAFAFALAALPGRGTWPLQPVCLGARGINGVLQAVQTRLVASGYVTTRVVARPQDLTTGQLVLTLVPGRVRAIRTEGGDARATLRNAMPLAAGSVLNLQDVEQALETFKRLPTADADIQIVPADEAGQSDLVVRWQQAFPLRVSLNVDDSGSRATGRYQGSVSLAYDGALDLNDLLSLTLSRDLEAGGGKGTRGSTVQYSVPWGYWLLGFTGGSNAYHQSVAGLNQTYLYSGDSRNGELQLSRVVYRDAVRKTNASFSGWTRSSSNFIDDTEVEVQRRRMAGWEFGIGHREAIGAAGLDLHLAYRRGTGAHGAIAAPEEAFGEGTSRPRIVKADARLDLPFALGGQRLHYSVAWRAQWNRTPLVPQDRFSIGNRYTVRGFDGETSLLAERGWLFRNDVGVVLADSGAEAYVGVDQGQVGGPSAARLIGRRLVGAVVGLRGGFRRIGYDAFVGRPLSMPPGYQTASTTAGFSVNWSY